MSNSPEIRPGTDRQIWRKMADPAALLLAAEAAPKLFDIGGYYQALHVMREKGYSWRHLGEWVRGFNIEISHVHLRRLYIQESESRGQATAQKSTVAAVSGKRKPERRPRTEPAKDQPLVDAETPAAAFQQEDLLRYEGMSRDEAGPGFNLRAD